MGSCCSSASPSHLALEQTSTNKSDHEKQAKEQHDHEPNIQTSETTNQEAIAHKPIAAMPTKPHLLELLRTTDKVSPQLVSVVGHETTEDEKKALLVSGFIRESQEVALPVEIIGICTAYYDIFGGCFVKGGPFMSISTTSNTNDTVMTRAEAPFNTAYGSFVIDGTESPNQICRWSFKFSHQTHRKKNWMIFVGIDNSPNFEKISTDINTMMSSTTFYAFVASRGQLMSSLHYNRQYPFQGGACGADSRMTMEVNCRARTISFSIDGGEFVTAFTDIDVEKRYRFAVSLIGQGNTVQIINCQIFNDPGAI